MQYRTPIFSNGPNTAVAINTDLTSRIGLVRAHPRLDFRDNKL